MKVKFLLSQFKSVSVAIKSDGMEQRNFSLFSKAIRKRTQNTWHMYQVINGISLINVHNRCFYDDKY